MGSGQEAQDRPRERLVVVPRTELPRLRRDPVLRALLVTDAGWFPSAAGHARRRPQGAPEAVLLLCTGGAGSYELDGARHPVGPGGVVVLPAGRAHAYRADDARPWTIWWWHLEGASVPALLAQVGAGSGAGSGAGPVRDLPRLTALADEALRALEDGLTAERLRIASGCVWHLLVLLAAGSAAARPDPVEQVLRLLGARLDRTPALAEIAAEVGLSPSHLSALFRTSTGSSVLRTATALKMRAARELLAQGAPVGEVARRTGYADPFYFSRRFARFHGISPSAFSAERRQLDALEPPAAPGSTGGASSS